MSEISSLIENKKVRKIEVSGFRLKGHLLRITDAMIYVENISMISASSLPFPPVPVWAFLCLGIGFLVWKSQEMQRYYGHMDSVSYMAVMLMLVGIGIIIKWIYNAYDNSKSKYLNIVMNS